MIDGGRQILLGWGFPRTSPKPWRLSCGVAFLPLGPGMLKSLGSHGKGGRCSTRRKEWRYEQTQKCGHSSVSLLVPPGAQAWSGAPDKEVRVRLDTEGVYLYECAAHKMMGMAGVILVGKPVNLDEARRVAKAESAKFLLNKDRLEAELEQIK